MKETDNNCQICINYDSCLKESSNNCGEYEYYKCSGCMDRVTESDGVPKCFRGGMPCMLIRGCSVERQVR